MLTELEDPSPPPLPPPPLLLLGIFREELEFGKIDSGIRG